MKKLFCVLLMFFAVDCFAIGGHGTITIHAQEITLQWDANTEPDLAGYRLYQSDKSGPPYNMVDVPISKDKTEITISVSDGQYYWVLTAFDTERLESDYSKEVSITVDTTPPAAPSGLKAFIKQFLSFFSRGSHAFKIRG